MSVTWQYSIGNLVSRAPAVPEAVAPAVEDSLLPFSNLGNGYPDILSGFEWRSDGLYDATFDLNLLATDSDRADTVYGWRDYLLFLAGTPGLSTYQMVQGTYGGRTNVYCVYRPFFQDIEVMPGEDVRINFGLYLDSGGEGGGTTAVVASVVVIDLWSGNSWDGSTNAWTSTGVVAAQTSTDSWLDVQEVITADTDRNVRSTYRVILIPTATPLGQYSYIYVSQYNTNGTPSLVAEADMAAVIGHNFPEGTTLSFGPIASMTPFFQQFYGTVASSYTQTWTLSVAQPGYYAAQPRPVIGEIWVGSARTFLRTPRTVQIREGDWGQQRVEGARGRVEVLPDRTVLPNSELVFQYKLTESEYEQVRDEVLRGSLYGAEPMFLIPDSTFEGANRLYHVRVGDIVQVGRIGNSIRTFSVAMTESPFAAA